MDHFFYARHFLFLTCFSVLLIIITQLSILSDLTASFALYGALHALALVITVRAQHPLWRKCLFIAIAAILSVLTLRVGIFAGQWSGTLAGNPVLYAVPAMCAVIGAVSYGILMRLLGVYELTQNSLAILSIGCALAAYVAFVTLAHAHFLGRWWLAVLWWYACSGGLLYCDRRQNARNQ
jgi:hypothetical protein